MEKLIKNREIIALLDEYKKAITELEEALIHNLVTPLTDSKLPKIIDHVIGYGLHYVDRMREHISDTSEYSYNYQPPCNDIDSCLKRLSMMYSFTEEFFSKNPELLLNEYETDKKILMKWGQRYDVEQLLEHAIIHVMRHRRQIINLSK